MFIGPDIIAEGIQILLAEIEVQRRLAREIVEDKWPAEYDPNDLEVFQMVLQRFEQHRSTGYNEPHADSKPMRMFFQLLKEKRRIG